MMDSSRLASYVASRICHDVASPLTSMMQCMELMFDDSLGPAMKAEGEKALRTGLGRFIAVAAARHAAFASRYEFLCAFRIWRLANVPPHPGH